MQSMTGYFLLIQFADKSGNTRAGVVSDDGQYVREINADSGVYGLARVALREGRSLLQQVKEQGFLGEHNYDTLVESDRFLPPVTHPEPAHCMLSGTGLTYRASAEGRDAMHKAAAAGNATDTIRMYEIGEAGGRPPEGHIGSPPEWFYKGDGTSLVAPGADLPLPAFAEDGGDEVELAGVYIVDTDGSPVRIGVTLSNEYADHEIEKQNYLYLAHSKLRAAAIGPELLVGDVPGSFPGQVVIRRNAVPIWRKEFVLGEDHMCHTIGNLEHHHFKYAQFRRPGDVHVHFFGAAAVSFSEGVRTQPGDIFEISAKPFTKPLVNRLAPVADEGLIEVRAL
jgi:hypothetical protein